MHSNVPEEFWEDANDFLADDWQIPDTDAIREMKATLAKQPGCLVEVALSTHWVPRTRRLACGYSMYLYARDSGSIKRIVSKDWDDDIEIGGVSTEKAVRWQALPYLLARVMAIVLALGSPSLRVYTEDTWTSGVIKPVAGRRTGVKGAATRRLVASQHILRHYREWPQGIFAYGYRRDEREETSDGAPTAYQKRFSHIKRRLRDLAEPGRPITDTLWVDLVRVAEVIEKTPRAEGEKRPTFSQAMFYHLRHERKMPARAVADLAGVPVSQVNRAYRAVHARFEQQPDFGDELAELPQQELSSSPVAELHTRDDVQMYRAGGEVSTAGCLFVAGVPGVGKSTVLEAVAEATGIPCVTFGDLILRVARNDGFQGSRDALRSLPSATLEAYRADVALTLPPACLLDGHLTIERGHEFVPAVPAALATKGALGGVVVLEAEPAAIAQRRAARARDSGSPEPGSVLAHQAANAAAARSLAVSTGAWIEFIDANGTPAEVLRRVQDALAMRADAKRPA